MPDSTTDPGQTAADLDRWCLRHFEANGGALPNSIEDCMVSANVPEYAPLIEMNRLTRTGLT